jgi:hypothetical protein
MIDLRNLYNSLSGPPTYSVSELQFTGTAIPNSLHHIAKDAEGQPVILFKVRQSSVRPASILLRNLQIDHELRCRVRPRDGTETVNTFSIVRCLSTAEPLQKTFFDLISVLLLQLSNQPTSRELSELFDRVSALFLALERPASRSVQGLWGELFLINRSKDARLFVESWHIEAAEHYDFAREHHRLEVKTCGDRSRTHHFSYEQVYPPPGIWVGVASMFTEKTSAGASLGELWDQARNLVSNNSMLRLKVDQVCMQSLGDSWEGARDVRFDSTLAAQSLAFYHIEDIPRIPTPLPVGVSTVRFCSNLSVGKTLGSDSAGPLVTSLIT